MALVATTVLAVCARDRETPGQRPESAGIPISAFPSNPALEDTIRFYIDKLGDQSFTSTYGHEDEPYTWYIAAERLGQIGAPAVPHLIAVLGASDAHAEMLALYALMLAVQDTAVLSRTKRQAIGYHSVLTGSDNAANRRLALAWWAKHRHLWRPNGQVSDSAAIHRKAPTPP